MNGNLVYDDVFEGHKTGDRHPERPDRVRVIREGCQAIEDPPWTVLDPDRRASGEKIAGVHQEQYIHSVKDASDKGRTLDADTPTSSQSYDTALLAAGTSLLLSESALHENKPGFGVIRPPGHHAEPARGMGFCLFNNIAIAAHVLSKQGLSVAIVDIDVHHGNGTQKMFYARDDILYVSFHQSPFYPGTGAEDETGRGKGEGYTLNIPLQAGSGWSTLEEHWNGAIKESIKKFAPDVMMISAGFDGHKNDPVGGLSLTDEDYLSMAEDLRKWSTQQCNGRILALLEGGYNLETLRRLVPSFIKKLFY